MSVPQQLREESDFDQLPHNIAISATIADVEENKGFIDYFMFVMEVKTKGGSKYLTYRRYREFFNLHQVLESKYSPEDPERPGPNTCVLPSLPGERCLVSTLFTFTVCEALGCTDKLSDLQC
ncbi:neutrophil cytosol factor 4-like [Anarrhichthys ocellatus]|uniref:neutrophil cytosol factor 4-like n=1 Tax=Anarrhichthys ocellatus TaxID=433405 RepID=UPI0012EE6490|nr:neutrophil cytosol factor 4-like [Anarrhichthys ocellatus]